MSKNTLRIATRKSLLAMWQADHIKNRLEAMYPDTRIELLGFTTQGDRILDAPLAKIGGKGLFVKELENALLDGRADLAVHSVKDVPMALPPGLAMPVLCERENPGDALVSNQFAAIEALPQGAVVGTSSLRRQSQLLSLRPDLQVKTLRGNLQTRLKKLDEGHYDAIILAAAGLQRLGYEERIRCVLSDEIILPAVGQGALGIECRADDSTLITLLEPLADEQTRQCVIAERAMNGRLSGGCQAPVAGYAKWEEGEIWLRGLVASVDGSTMLRGEVRGPADQASKLGNQLAEDLLARGAEAILAAARLSGA